MTMQERGETLFTTRIEDRDTFMARIQPGYSYDDFQRTMRTYDITKEAHKGKFRSGKERQFEHPRRATLILLDELGITDPDIIIAALLHDTGEDTALQGPWEPHKGMLNSEWRETAAWRLKTGWGEKVSEIVLALTKPFIDGKEVLTKEQQEEMYLEGLRNASPEALLVKMADRLDNLRTLHFRTPENGRRKIEETEQFYFPIFERAAEKYPRETALMLDKLRMAIVANRERLSHIDLQDEIHDLDAFEKLLFTQLIAGIDDRTTTRTHRYDYALIQQSRKDIMDLLGVKTIPGAVQKLLEIRKLKPEDIDGDFNTYGYLGLSGKERKVIDTIIDPANDALTTEELAKHLKMKPKDFTRLRDSLFGILRVRNKLQLIVVVYICRTLPQDSESIKVLV